MEHTLGDDGPLLDDADDVGLARPQRTRAIACVLAALVLVVLDAGVVNIALPAMASSLQGTAAESVGIVTGYQMALVMALFPCAALGERLGYRRVYTAGVWLFVSASALCALAPSLALLVAARFMQGLGGAAIMSVGVALLRFVVPQQQLGAAIGWNALAVALSSAAAPSLGALVLSWASWPWLFAINLPLGALVLVATRALPQIPGTTHKLDLVSAALNAAAFGGLLVGPELMAQGPVLVAGLLAAGAVAMVALIRRELPKQAPMVPFDLLREGSFRVSVLASVCCFTGQGAAMVAMPFYLQHGLGQSALQTGLLITPWPLTVALVAPIAGRLVNRFSGAWLCAVGGTLLALGLAGAALWPLHPTPLAVIPFVTLCGLGFGLFQVPNNRNMLLAAPRVRSAAAGGMQGTARLTGQTFGAMAMTLLFTMTPLDLAPRIGFGIAAVLTLAAGLLSILRADVTARACSGAKLLGPVRASGDHLDPDPDTGPSGGFDIAAMPHALALFHHVAQGQVNPIGPVEVAARSSAEVFLGPVARALLSSAAGSVETGLTEVAVKPPAPQIVGHGVLSLDPQTWVVLERR